MPTYEYKCRDCGHQLDVVQSFTDEPLAVCPTCTGSLRKVFSPVGIVLKGSGFYRNDSRSSNGKSSSTNGSSSDAKSESSNGSSSKSETKSETKSDAKAEAKSETKKDSGSSSSDRRAAARK
jgi:putative FmdB family regulatory protein